MYAIKEKSWGPSKPANQVDYYSLLNNHLYINDALHFVPVFGTKKLKQEGHGFGLMVVRDHSLHASHEVTTRPVMVWY
jgi:hypothetical protein